MQQIHNFFSMKKSSSLQNMNHLFLPYHQLFRQVSKSLKQILILVFIYLSEQIILDSKINLPYDYPQFGVFFAGECHQHLHLHANNYIIHSQMITLW